MKGLLMASACRCVSVAFYDRLLASARHSCSAAPSKCFWQAQLLCKHAMNTPVDAAAPHITKWLDYYGRSFTPWDSRLPASQLVYYITSCIVDGDGFGAWDCGRGSSSTGPAASSDEQQGHQQQAVLRFSHQGSGYTATGPCLHACSRCAHVKPSPAPAATGSGWWALELGAGTGASCVFMAACGAHAVGVDCASAAVAEADAAATAAGVGTASSSGSSRGGDGFARFVVHDVFALPRPFTPHAACGLHTAQACMGGTQPGSNTQPGPPALHTSAAAQQTQALGAAGSTQSDPSGPPPSQLFDFIYDCQSFHVLRSINEGAYLQLLATSLRPGGLLLLLVGACVGSEGGGAGGQTGSGCNTEAGLMDVVVGSSSKGGTGEVCRNGRHAVLGQASSTDGSSGAVSLVSAGSSAPSTMQTVQLAEPPFLPQNQQQQPVTACGICTSPNTGTTDTTSAGAAKRLGPPQMSRGELMSCFGPPDWEWVTLALTRFDDTPYYKQHYDQPPLAWLGLLRRL